MKPALKALAKNNKNRYGYTIIEVMLVLAISTSFLFAAIAVFKGQQGETEFTQAIQDLNSKLINYADQVSAGTYPDSTSYSCNGSGPAIQLTASAGNLGGREGCLFMGRAVQVTKNSSTLHVYTVLGKMTQPGGDPSNDISNASPDPAVLSDGTWVMTDTYDLQGGTKVTKAWPDAYASSQDWYMAGIYNSLDPNAGSSGGGTQLSLRGYKLDGASAPFGTSSGGVKECIEEAPICAPQAISQWHLCLVNSDNSRTMLLTLQASNKGVSTQLADGGC